MCQALRLLNLAETKGHQLEFRNMVKSKLQHKLSRGMRFPTMWYVQPAKPQTSLCICAVWSEPLLVAWIFYDCLASLWTPFGVSKLNGKLHRLIWVCTCQNATLLEITCCGSNVNVMLFKLDFNATESKCIYLGDTCNKNPRPEIFVYSDTQAEP